MQAAKRTPDAAPAREGCGAAHTVALEGAAYSFRCGADEPILLSGLKAGVPLAYECGTGTCGSCRARLIEGKVATRWADAPGLAPQARASGAVLLCQAEPLTDCRVAATLRARGGERLPRVASVHASVATIEACAREMCRVTIALEQPLPFLPGQYVLLELPGVRGLRAYSLANAAAQDVSRLELYVRRTRGGRGSAVLCEPSMQGTRIRVHGPMGLAYLPDALSCDMVCVAGGSGLAPILSIVRSAAARGHLNAHRLALFVGARSEAHLFAIEELEALRARFPQTMQLVVSLSEAESGVAPGREAGFVHEALSRRMPGLANHEAFLAGPAKMVDACKRALILGGVGPRRIHFDRFA